MWWKEWTTKDMNKMYRKYIIWWAKSVIEKNITGMGGNGRGNQLQTQNRFNCQNPKAIHKIGDRLKGFDWVIPNEIVQLPWLADVVGQVVVLVGAFL